jgi:5'-methylthioadenosine phosphorylase
MIAIIGGSGFEKFEAFKKIKDLNRETPFGLASSGISLVEIEGIKVLFVSRHGKDHENLPSEVNYRANIYALKKHGAKAIVSFSAVGSLQKNLKPGDLVVPHQYIDRTKGLRAHTFLGQGLVGHVSLAKPICNFMSEKLKVITKGKNWDSHFGQTYICIEGPYFSTQAESKSYRMLGADIIGMTHFPEFALSREAGLPYLPCCFVTDYDCWDETIPHVTLAEVLQVMRLNNIKAFQITTEILNMSESFYNGSSNYNEGLRSGLMTPREFVPHEAWSWLDVLLGE